MKNSVIGTQVGALFQKNLNNLNNPVKNSVNGTLGTLLFFKERGRTENTSVKNSVNGTEITVLFSKEIGKE